MGRERGSERERDRDRDRDRYHRHRSHSRERDPSRRDRERERERRDRRSRSRSHSRSRSPRGNRRRSPVYMAGPSGKHDEAPMEELTAEEKQMAEVMGFASFHTTKGKKVDGNNAGAVHVIMKRKYRQYMNRKGGFNRPLDFVA
nr:U4/U6.U5 small nuclear ribonucleoprotein 27 kDa protein-like isoform X5 [Penaeus vannamei]